MSPRSSGRSTSRCIADGLEARSSIRAAASACSPELSPTACNGRFPIGLGVGDAVIAPVPCRALGATRARSPVRARARAAVRLCRATRRRLRTDAPRAGVDLLAADVGLMRASSLEALSPPWEPAEPAVLQPLTFASRLLERLGSDALAG